MYSLCYTVGRRSYSSEPEGEHHAAFFCWVLTERKQVHRMPAMDPTGTR